MSGKAVAQPRDVEAERRGAWPAPMLIDAHTHLYDCFDRATYFDATLATIRRVKQHHGLYLGDDTSQHTPACLLLAEPAGVYAFESLKQQGELDGGRWQFVACDDGLSLIAQCEGVDELLIIEGRQLQASDRVEILSLCSGQEFDDYRFGTEALLQLIIGVGGLPVIPIGVGKWWWERGRIIDRVLDGPLAEQICLGDNAGRLAMCPHPRHFTEAHKRGVWVLPGSGTLPFSSQATRVGRFGLILDKPIDRHAPAESIKRAILAGGEQPPVYGHPDNLLSFLKLQSAWHVRRFLNHRRDIPE